jgi:hypothetical protein
VTEASLYIIFDLTEGVLFFIFQVITKEWERIMNDNQRLEAITFEVNRRCFKDVDNTPDFQEFVIGPVAAIGAVVRSCIAVTNDTSDGTLVNAFKAESLVRPEFFWSPPDADSYRTFGHITIRLGENGSYGILLTPDELEKLGNGISAVFGGLPVEVVPKVFRAVRLTAPKPAPVQAPAPAPGGARSSSGFDDMDDDIPF